MSQLNNTLRKIKSEELLGRFRSKEDLYKYLTQQSNIYIFKTTDNIVNLFLPSYKGTKLSFIRAILSNQKKALRQQDVIVMNIPQYEEISVKNLYHDAMNDDILKQYLPDLDMNSNRFPERNFFFGILGTLKNDYLKQVISEANQRRYSVDDQNNQSDYIIIDDNWYNELIKHPFLSKKPGKAIHLIKQRSKLIRNRKVQHKFEISQRIVQQKENIEEQLIQSSILNNKRQKVNEEQSKSLYSYNSPNESMQFNI